MWRAASRSGWTVSTQPTANTRPTGARSERHDQRHGQPGGCGERQVALAGRCQLSQPRTHDQREPEVSDMTNATDSPEDVESGKSLWLDGVNSANREHTTNGSPK